MDRDGHFSDSELMDFADLNGGEGAAAREAHLMSCAECRKRLQEMENALGAYDEYHGKVLRPSLESTATWPSLAGRLTELEEHQRHFSSRLTTWWLLAAMAFCVAALAVFCQWEPPELQMRQVLAQAASAPEPVNRRVQFTSGAQSWYRPAVLRGQGTAGMSHVEALFVKADYSWDDPLSARSFAAWRNHLSEKRDRVTSIRESSGKRRFYRVETDTDRGALRTAALTLRADDFAAVKGAFEFEDKEAVTVSDAGEMTPEAATPTARQEVPVARGQMVETKVGPADELQVFAALNAIGADVGEPVNVDLDPAQRHVVVSEIGIAAARQHEIMSALESVPNAVSHFESEARPEAQIGASPDSYSSDIAAPFRQSLEKRAGGSQALQNIADRAIEESNELLEHAHALEVLAHKFAPAVEASFDNEQRTTLRKLRRQHGAAGERVAAGLRVLLKPLISSETGPQDGTPAVAGASWQGEAAAFFEAAKGLDAQVSRLLGGSYPEAWGRQTLSELPDELRIVEELAHSEATAE